MTAGEDALLGEQGLGRVEVDADPEGLDEPGAATGDLEEAVGAQPAQVAGAQFGDGAPEREVAGGVGEPSMTFGPV